MVSLKRKDDFLVNISPLLKIAGNWRRLLTGAATDEEIKLFRQHERTGRVLGDEDFLKQLEKNLGRVLRRQKPGPKRHPTQKLCMMSPELYVPGTLGCYELLF
jgi:putative transposase